MLPKPLSARSVGGGGISSKAIQGSFELFMEASWACRALKAHSENSGNNWGSDLLEKRRKSISAAPATSYAILLDSLPSTGKRCRTAQAGLCSLLGPSWALQYKDGWRKWGWNQKKSTIFLWPFSALISGKPAEPRCCCKCFGRVNRA